MSAFILIVANLLVNNVLITGVKSEAGILERGKKAMEGVERTHVISAQDEDQSMLEVRTSYSYYFISLFSMRKSLNRRYRVRRRVSTMRTWPF